MWLLPSLETRITAHLVGHSIRVYGGGYGWQQQWPEIETKDELLREPADMIAMGCHGVRHSPETTVERDGITIREPKRPHRVHIEVETCYLDPYYVYTVIFEAGVIVDAYGDLR